MQVTSSVMDTAKVRERVREGADVCVTFLHKHLKGRAVVAGLTLGNLVLLALYLSQGSAPTQVQEERKERDSGSGPQYSSDSTGGALFTRWGRTECPNEDQFVYKGVAGGSHYTHTGSGSNYLCLPSDPIFEDIIPGVQNFGIMYGAEYEAAGSSFVPFSRENMGGATDQLLDNNVPCAVCRSRQRTTALMIPARSRCYDGWHLEYQGYLMSAHHGHKGKSEFVCMDRAPEADPAGFRDENGALFYTVEGACGSLPCPPYGAGKELTCVVCTL